MYTYRMMIYVYIYIYIYICLDFFGYVLNKKKIYGWARHDYSLSYFNELDNIEKIDEAFNYAIKNNLKVALRANGRSYGDNSLNDDIHFLVEKF